jgi:hypothetical protein
VQTSKSIRAQASTPCNLETATNGNKNLKDCEEKRKGMQPSRGSGGRGFSTQHFRKQKGGIKEQRFKHANLAKCNIKTKTDRWRNPEKIYTQSDKHYK